MLVLICVMIFAFIVTVAFSVDIAYMHLVKAELRSSTDAAAKAAAQTLATTQDVDQAIASGKAIAELNEVAGQPLKLKSDDFIFGSSLPMQRDATNSLQTKAQSTAFKSEALAIVPPYRVQSDSSSDACSDGKTSNHRRSHCNFHGT